MLYSHGDGPLPWVLPRSRSKGGEIEPSSKLIQAFLPEPSVVRRYRAQRIYMLQSYICGLWNKNLTLINRNNAGRNIMSIAVAYCFTEVD
jgi:hypothetical protein